MKTVLARLILVVACCSACDPGESDQGSMPDAAPPEEDAWPSPPDAARPPPVPPDMALAQDAHIVDADLRPPPAQALRLNQTQQRGAWMSYHRSDRALLMAPGHEFIRPALGEQLVRLGWRAFHFDAYPLTGLDENWRFDLTPVVKALERYPDSLSVCTPWSDARLSLLDSCALDIANACLARDHYPLRPPGIELIDAHPTAEATLRHFLWSLEGTAFTRDGYVLPRMVQGERATLREAVKLDGWPTVDQFRDKSLGVLIGSPEFQTIYRTHYEPYPDDDNMGIDAGWERFGDERDKIYFVSGDAPADDIVIIRVQVEQLRNPDQILGWVESGYILWFYSNDPVELEVARRLG
ncbi:MAG: hypothetical protein KC620_16380, partial [Myxococcales bacterium]|nr:hypothetical protein [Myxococcales bacterium]